MSTSGKILLTSFGNFCSISVNNYKRFLDTLTAILKQFHGFLRKRSNSESGRSVNTSDKENRIEYSDDECRNGYCYRT